MMSTLMVPYWSHANPASDKALVLQKQDRLMQGLESLTKQGGASQGELAVIYEEGIKIRNELAYGGVSTSKLDETLIPLGKILSISRKLEQCHLDSISKELTAQAVTTEGENKFSFAPCTLEDRTTKTVVQLSDSIKDIEKKLPPSSGVTTDLKTLRNLIAQKTKEGVLRAYFKMASQYLETIEPEQDLDAYIKNKMSARGIDFDAFTPIIPLKDSSYGVWSQIQSILASQPPKEVTSRTKNLEDLQARLNSEFTQIAHHFSHERYWDRVQGTLRDVSNAQDWESADENRARKALRGLPSVKPSVMKDLPLTNSNDIVALPPDEAPPHGGHFASEQQKDEISGPSMETFKWITEASPQTSQGKVPGDLAIVKSYLSDLDIEVAWDSSQDPGSKILNRRPKAQRLHLSQQMPPSNETRELVIKAMGRVLSPVYADPHRQNESASEFIRTLDDEISSWREDRTVRGEDSHVMTEDEFRHMMWKSVKSIPVVIDPSSTVSLTDFSDDQHRDHRQQKQTRQRAVEDQTQLAYSPGFKNFMKWGSNEHGITKEMLADEISKYERNSLEFLGRIEELYEGDSDDEILAQIGRAIRFNPSIIAEILLEGKEDLASILCELSQKAQALEKDQADQDDIYRLAGMVLGGVTFAGGVGLVFVAPPAGGAAMYGGLGMMSVGMATNAGLSYVEYQAYQDSKANRDLAHLAHSQWGDNSDAELYELRSQASQKLLMASIAIGTSALEVGTLGAASGFKALRGLSAGSLRLISRARSSAEAIDRYVEALRTGSRTRVGPRIIRPSLNPPASRSLRVIDAKAPAPIVDARHIWSVLSPERVDFMIQRGEAAVQALPEPQEWEGVIDFAARSEKLPLQAKQLLVQGIYDAEQGNFVRLAFLRDRLKTYYRISQGNTTSGQRIVVSSKSPAAGPSKKTVTAHLVGHEPTTKSNPLIVSENTVLTSDQTGQMTTLEKLQGPPLDEGAHVRVYEHPTDPNLVVKVLKDGDNTLPDFNRLLENDRLMGELGFSDHLPKVKDVYAIPDGSGRKPVVIVEERVLTEEAFKKLTGRNFPSAGQNKLDQLSVAMAKKGRAVEVRDSNVGMSFNQKGEPVPVLLDRDDMTYVTELTVQEVTGKPIQPAPFGQPLREVQPILEGDRLWFIPEDGGDPIYFSDAVGRAEINSGVFSEKVKKELLDNLGAGNRIFFCRDKERRIIGRIYLSPSMTDGLSRHPSLRITHGADAPPARPTLTVVDPSTVSALPSTRTAVRSSGSVSNPADTAKIDEWVRVPEPELIMVPE